MDWDSLVLGPLESVFGETVTFMPVDGQPFTARGIFDEAYREVDLAGGMAVTTESPVLGIRVSEFQSPFQPLPRQDDKVNVHSRAATYIIREVRLDGHGSAKLMLNLSP